MRRDLIFTRKIARRRDKFFSSKLLNELAISLLRFQLLVDASQPASHLDSHPAQFVAHKRKI